jgi:H+-translocating NAD(P) transhydrogenase
MKFILSIGPQTTKQEGFFQIDLEDDAVQNMLIAYNGEARWPDKITPYSLPPPPPKTEVVELSDEEKIVIANEQQKADYLKNSAIASVATIALLAFGFTTDSPGATSLLATFCLAGLAGYQVVWGVAPALHSPVSVVINNAPTQLFPTELTGLHDIVDGCDQCNQWHDSCRWNAVARP